MLLNLCAKHNGTQNRCCSLVHRRRKSNTDQKKVGKRSGQNRRNSFELVTLSYTIANPIGEWVLLPKKFAVPCTTVRLSKDVMCSRYVGDIIVVMTCCVWFSCHRPCDVGVNGRDRVGPGIDLTIKNDQLRRLEADGEALKVHRDAWLAVTPFISPKPQ